mmetsp:Transcript_36423/g.116736  ORF Transcript_36423/g.116736 Transcript_36423/m.116736 type:complete len:323 (-) Transcript_36423:797-1765(-)
MVFSLATPLSSSFSAEEDFGLRRCGDRVRDRRVVRGVDSRVAGPERVRARGARARRRRRPRVVGERLPLRERAIPLRGAVAGAVAESAQARLPGHRRRAGVDHLRQMGLFLTFNEVRRGRWRRRLSRPNPSGARRARRPGPVATAFESPRAPGIGHLRLAPGGHTRRSLRRTDSRRQIRAGLSGGPDQGRPVEAICSFPRRPPNYRLLPSELARHARLFAAGRHHRGSPDFFDGLHALGLLQTGRDPRLPRRRHERHRRRPPTGHLERRSRRRRRRRRTQDDHHPKEEVLRSHQGRGRRVGRRLRRKRRDSSGLTRREADVG